MKCEVCEKTIIGRRSDSQYCSTACRNKAYKMRTSEKHLNELDDDYPTNSLDAPLQQMNENASAELRSIEREHFDKILNLRTEYGDKIRDLKESNLKHEFKIERLNDKISDLREKHIKELAESSTNSTKETVAAISQMPAIQSALGAFTSKLIPSSASALGGVSDQFNEQEKQIIDAIRRMQPDIQGSLVQMLYVLFAKTHDEQTEIFNTLQAFMTQPDESEDV